jgi:hypothetical protein
MALGQDPWLDTWPALLEVTPARAPLPCVSDKADAPPGAAIGGLLAEYAMALGQDPWLDTWPALLEVTPARAPLPCVSDAAGDALPLHPGAADRWPLFALSGGRPVTVAGEWTQRGLWPLTAWAQGGMVRL